MPFIRLITIYIVVIAAVFALFNRDKVMELTGLSPNMFRAQDDADKTPQEQEEEEAAAIPRDEASGDVAKAEPTPATETETAPADKPVQPEAQEDAEQAATQPATSEVAAAPKTPAEPVGTPQQEPAGKTVVPAPQQNAKAAIAKALNAARQSYRSGNFQQTEARYVALGDQYPDNADVQGEIGNFYYAQRQYPNAATYYYKTGKALLKSGDQAKLGQIINILQRLAPNMAADLRAQAAN
jgi:outer membrane biosynthesis protein TonB